MGTSPNKKVRASFQHADDLLDFYIERYIEKFNRKPSVTYSKDKYKFVDLLKTERFDQVMSIIRYYISIEDNPSVEDLVFNYHAILELKAKVESDKLERKRLLNKTKLAVEKFKGENE